MKNKSVDIALPVYNEEKLLKQNFLVINDYFQKNLKNYLWQIVIVNNGSTDNTNKIIEEIIREFPNVRHLYIERKGKGRALRKIFTESTADIIFYTDIDLSTKLEYAMKLITQIESGCDIANSSRFIDGAKVKRKFIRSITGWIVRKTIRLLFSSKITDFGCGFKAIKREAAAKIAGLVKSNRWLFETEFMLIAEQMGYDIKEDPVQWEEGKSSKMNIFTTAIETLLFIIGFCLQKKELLP